MPSIRWAPVFPPDRTGDSAGSTATIAMRGSKARRASPVPRMEAAIPLWRGAQAKLDKTRSLGRRLAESADALGRKGESR